MEDGVYLEKTLKKKFVLKKYIKCEDNVKMNKLEFHYYKASYLIFIGYH